MLLNLDMINGWFLSFIIFDNFIFGLGRPHISFSEIWGDIMNNSVQNWSVTLDVGPGEWIARIVGRPYESTEQYAFYLMRGKERVAIRWYECKPEVSFPMPADGGVYHVIGFIKSDENSSPKYIASESIRYSGSLQYDLAQWKAPVFDHDIEEGWPEKGLIQNGIHRFLVGNTSVDIRVDGIEKLRSGGAVLVCFGGAVPARTEKRAPFFSGVGVAGKIGLPLLAIADPSLSLSANLALGWYAGNQGVSNLQILISRLLDNFAEVCDAKFLMFGGSGGGFATIASIGLMKSEAVAAVWNPQTSISRYERSAVEKYLQYAYPDVNRSDSEDLYGSLTKANVIHDLVGAEFVCKNSIIYLQNQSDTLHVERHAFPYARALRAEQMSDTVLYADRDVAIWFGCWGKGHVVPPSEIILKTLQTLSVGGAVLDLAMSLERSSGPCPKISFT